MKIVFQASEIAAEYLTALSAEAPDQGRGSTGLRAQEADIFLFQQAEHRPVAIHGEVQDPIHREQGSTAPQSGDVVI